MTQSIVEMPDDTPSAARLESTASAFQQRTGLWVAALVALDVLSALNLSKANPLWHDELFTYVIAKASSVGEMYRQINATDMNPPLSYLLTRWSFHLFGVGTLQCRLPEITGFLLAVLCLFFLVRRYLGNVAGFLAGCLLLSSEAVGVSYQARPYGLLLGLTALALLAWRGSAEAADRRRAWGYNGLLLVSLALLLLTHIFGLIGWGAVALGELTAVFHRKRLDAGRTLALLLPLGSAVLYRPFFQLHAHTVYPPAFQPHPGSVLPFYMLYGQTAVYSIVATVIFALVTQRRNWLSGTGTFPLPMPLWVAVGVLGVSPAVLILRLWRSHGAFWPRYGSLVTIAVALAASAFLAWWTRNRAGAALLSAAVALVLSHSLQTAAGAVVHFRRLQHPEPAVILSNLQSMTDPNLPIVDASGLTFLEMNFREPTTLLSRVYYLTGGPLAVKYSHATIFEIMDVEKEQFKMPGQVERYNDFVAQHPRFYVLGDLGYPEDWLLNKLMADHAHIVLLGEDKTSYKDSELYEVNLSSTTERP